MKQVESENELAFVLGHELGHFRNRDHLKSLGRDLALALLIATLSQGSSVGDLAALSGDLAGRSFSREQEEKPKRTPTVCPWLSPSSATWKAPPISSRSFRLPRTSWSAR
jgi:hypothetical protein